MAAIGRYQRKTAVSEKARRDGAVFNPVFKAPSVHKYDTEDYRHLIRSLAVMGHCCVCDTIRSSGNAAGAGWRV